MKLEVRIHGRGGQGVVTAAELLSLAAFDQGLHAQALPSFGSERTGAPVVAFCPDRRPADPVARPGRAAPTSWSSRTRPCCATGDCLAGLADDGAVVVNTIREPRPSSSRRGLEPGPALSCAVTVPANELSRELLGRPLPNTALLGAVAAAHRRRGAWRPSPVRSAERFAEAGQGVVDANIRLAEDAVSSS